jgi:hypothetical protein
MRIGGDVLCLRDRRRRKCGWLLSAWMHAIERWSVGALPREE